MTTRADTAPLNILVDLDLPEALQARIRAVDPRIRLSVDPEGYQPGRRRGAGAQAAPSTEDLARWWREAEVLVTFRLPKDLGERAPNLRWVQLLTAGIDHFVRSGALDLPLTFTKASGVVSTPIAEYVLWGMLSFAKRAPEAMRYQRESQWKRFALRSLTGQTVGIVGLGAIGREVARLAKPFGLRVLATRRGAAPGQHEPNVDELIPADRLDDLLAASDYVVLAVPATPETERLIDAAALARMKPTAVVINVARGTVIDQDALTAALRAERIGGAVLDVFDPEPLPADSPLWALPNCLITAHISGWDSRYNEHAVALFVDNLRRYLAGEPLRNLVDKAAGY